jgi:L,D-transpeptidase YcbB
MYGNLPWPDICPVRQNQMFTVIFMRMRKFIFIALAGVGLIFCLGKGAAVCADSSYTVAEHIEAKIRAADPSSGKSCLNGGVCISALTRKFYADRKFQPGWINSAGPLPAARELLDVIRDSSREGLKPSDYFLSRLESSLDFVAANSQSRIIPVHEKYAQFDLLFSEAFFLYASHLYFGKVDHRKAYPEWVMYQRSGDLTVVLGGALASGKIRKSLNQLMPAHSGYEKLKEKLSLYRRIAENGGWPRIPKGEKMKKGAKGNRVAVLKQRLAASGDLDALLAKEGDVFDRNLEEAVLKFQKRHGLKSDGAVGRETLDALNVPVEKRISQIELNMDRMRWLPDELGGRHILVNIADFDLKVVENHQDVMSMRIIAGKRDWRSCVLSAKMTYMEVNPYWNVPQSIALKEILPAVRKDPGYLSRKNIKIIKNWEEQGKGVDPSAIDWSKMQKNFPYRFRQEPGRRNPLGRIKFIFPNACEIYLHDTPTNHLFGRQRRDFSHGCIRVEKPLELAAHLLKDQDSWTKQKIQAEIHKGKRKVIMLAKPLDVHIFYGTAFVDNEGNLQFRNDIYQIDEVPNPQAIADGRQG